MSGKFSIAISGFKVKTEAKMLRAVRWICLEITKRVIMKTPVDTGRARNSWTPSIGVARFDGGGLEAAQGVLAGMRLGDAFFLTSNLPYMPVLEYGLYPNPPKRGTYVKGSGYEIRSVGGFSRKAPKGMVRITLAEFPGIVAGSVGKE